MSHSLSKLLVHLVFSTKNHQPLIQDDIRQELHTYLTGFLTARECPSLLANSEPGHAHILFALPWDRALAEIVNEVKKGSLTWIKSMGQAYAEFNWQAGYGAFAVSESQRDEVMQYIADQREHHRRMTFQEELRALFYAQWHRV